MDVTITGIQSIPIKSGTPTDQDVLTYISANSQWESKPSVPTLQTAGQGAILCPPDFDFSTASASSQMSFGANGLACSQFICSHTIAINKVSLKVSSSAAASTGFVGIYSADGNTKLLQAAFDTSSTGVKTTTLGAAVVLHINAVYWYVTSNTDNSVRVSGTSSSGFIGDIVNANSPHLGSSANSVSGGNLPSTLGSITGQSSISLGASVLEP